jgi:type II secretory pathway component PulJ
MIRPPRRAGFTLIEVLGAIVVTAMVLGFATDYYIDLSRATNRAAGHTRDIRHATALLDRIARDFESTLLIVKPAETDPLAHPWLFLAESRYSESGADQIKFVTRSFRPRRSQEHESDLTLVAYTLHRNEAEVGFDLLRWTALQLPESLDRSFPSRDDEASVLLAEGLLDFGVTFTGGAEDQTDHWDSTTLEQSSTLPTSVEISVAIADPDANAVSDDITYYRRRVLLPMRPLDFEALTDPALVAGAEDSGAEDEDGAGEGDGDVGGVKLADCLDVAGLGTAAEGYPAFESFAQASADLPWEEVKDMIPDDLWGFVLAKPECQ